MIRYDDLKCDDCGHQLEKNDFIAIIGKTPSTELSIPVGRTDSVLKKIGNIYCERCFKKRFDRK